MNIQINSTEPWFRGTEHESMLSIYNEKTSIRFENLKDKEKDALEWYLVETLPIWPHPKAPRSKRQARYSTYEMGAYQRLVMKNTPEAPGYAGRDEIGGSDF